MSELTEDCFQGKLGWDVGRPLEFDGDDVSKYSEGFDQLLEPINCSKTILQFNIQLFNVQNSHLYTLKRNIIMH